MGGGKKVVIEPHRHEGVFISRGKEDALLTKNMVMGESVYGEKRISVDDENGKLEYRVWNPFRSKLAAAILGGVDKIHMTPGSKVLYLGAASGTSVSHVSDVVGPEGMVYAVEFSHRSGRCVFLMITHMDPFFSVSRLKSHAAIFMGRNQGIGADQKFPALGSREKKVVIIKTDHLFQASKKFS